MNELTYLERQEAAANERIRRAVGGDDDHEPPIEILERVTREHPFLAVGGDTTVGGVIGALLGRAPGGTILGLAKFASKPVWWKLGRVLMG